MRDQPLPRAIAGAILIAFSGVWFALSDAPPAVATFYRCALAWPVLALIARRGERLHGALTRRERIPGVLAGAFFTGDLIMAFAGVDQIGVGLAMVLNNTQVVFVALAAWLLLGERLDRRTMSAIPVVLVGIVLISGLVGEGSYGEDPVLGALLSLAAAVCYSGFILLIRHGNPGLRHAASVLRDATAVAAFGGLLVVLIQGQPAALIPSWPMIGWLLCLALGSQVLAWLLISYSLPRLPAATTSIVLLLQPVTSVVVGMLLLAERPSAIQLTGVAIVVGGVLVATLSRQATRPASAHRNGPKVASEP